MKNKTKEIIFFAFSLLFIALLVFFLMIFGPDRLIEYIGVNNGYLILFLLSIFGGVSAFTSASFYATMSSFYLGGLNFFILIILGAIGLTIGDSLFYYLGRKGHDLSKNTNYNKKINYLNKLMHKIPPRWTFLFIFLYAGLTIFPKDILCFALGLGKYNYLRSMIPMLFGNVLFNFLFLFLISIGFNVNIIH